MVIAKVAQCLKEVERVVVVCFSVQTVMKNIVKKSCQQLIEPEDKAMEKEQVKAKQSDVDIYY